MHAVSNERIRPIVSATMETTEEAIVYAILDATTMTGVDGHKVLALPRDLGSAQTKYKKAITGAARKHASKPPRSTR